MGTSNDADQPAPAASSAPTVPHEDAYSTHRCHFLALVLISTKEKQHEHI
jgi:hypothetical protein